MSSETLRTLGLALSKLRALLSDAKHDTHRIRTLQDTLAETLSSNFWHSPEIQAAPTASPHVWNETLSLVASGRVLSVAAQADEALAAAGADVAERSWTGDGRAYAKWLGDGVVELALGLGSSGEGKGEAWRRVGDLCGRSLSLGYPDDVVQQVIARLLLQRPSQVTAFQDVARALAKHRQRHFLDSTLGFLRRKMEGVKGAGTGGHRLQDGKVLAGAAAILQMLVRLEDTGFCDFLSAWLIKANVASTDLYRSAIAALNEDEREKILDKSWQQFGDKLYIKHTPIIQQEALAQILLLTAGYVHRANPMQVFVLARSSIHTSGTSDRLASSSLRVRFLGMIVGMTVSQLVDKPDSQMTFDIEDVETEEAKWYQRLVYIADKVGKVEDLVSDETAKQNDKVIDLPIKRPTKLAQKDTKPKIVEVVSNEDDDDGLTPYAKPDSDPEDEDEDATLVQRDKPKPPVYIRDLISGLQDAENYEHHRLSLVTAPTLIRRKADFGTELKDRTEELAGVLVSLHDNFDMEEFHDLRLQSMIALLVAQPAIMGPWFARMFFSGDYSIGQRASVLTALGLGARELAGIKEDQHKGEQFPSKTLPERLHKLYADSTEVNAVAKRLEQAMIQPVSTKRRKKLIRNDLAKTVAENFFFPLTGRWQGIGQVSGAEHTYLSPLLLPTYLKTLAIILTSAGSSTLALPQMTAEFWDLLLSIRSLAQDEAAILEAALFSFLTILNMNEDKRRLAQEHSRRLLETHEWTQMVFDKTSGGDQDSEKCRTLAAGVLVATKEVLEGYQRLMLGDMADF